MDQFLFMLVIALCGTCCYGLRVEGLGRINNGLPAPADQFRYMVSLQKKSEVASQTRGHRCGGALISLTHVVTAAYCVFDNETQINPADYRIFGGATLLTNDSSADRIRNIAKIEPYSTYTNLNGTKLADIAIITLETPFLNDTVETLNLATDMGPDPSSEHSCVFSGWGARSSTPTASEELIVLQKLVFNSVSCVFTLTGSISSLQMCAYTKDIATASCVGDEGGPLVCNGLLTGILSMHDNCVVSATRPEVYTRVFSYTDWIKSITNAAPNLQPGALVLTLLVVLQKIIAHINH